MPDINNAELIVKQIKEEENTTTAIGYLADLIMNTQTNLQRDIDGINKHLLGNGDPEKGLIYQVKSLKSKMAIVIWVGGIIGTAIIIAIVENWLTF